MATDRFRLVERIFAEAVAQPVALRGELLDRACGPDDAMRAEIASLLAAAQQAGDFLSTPALDLFAQQISRAGWNVQPGDHIGCYTVDRRLGAGGMGEVWRARDDRLGRDVAIKVLLPQSSDGAGQVRALQREARAAGSLNHTNVLTVYDVGDHRGAPYLVTECLEGASLRARLGAGPLSLDAALEVAVQVARGLGAAHERGIVHRDLKPENIFLAQDGRAKILDFGLATLRDNPAPQSSSGAELSGGTTRSLVGGTAGYMAPEQVRGEAVDPRADIFALGAVLYEMLANRGPFRGGSKLEVLQAVLTAQPEDLRAANPEIPSGLSDLVRRCLAKSRDERFATVAEVASALEAIVQARKRAPRTTMLALLRRPVVMATLLLAVIAMSAGVWRWRVATERIRWARTVAAPEVERLIREQRTAEAFVLARKALEAVPGDPYLRQLWLDVSLPGVLTTDPAGADVTFAPYQAAVTEWSSLGQTPLQRVPIPRGLFRLRISKAGFQTIEGTGAPGALQRYRLDPVAEVPPGMVRVVRGRYHVRSDAIGALDDFWIDRFEVTNRQFKDFVDQGGYRRRDYWREAFHDGSRTLPWEAAMEKLRDTTGQPGPATWASGTYPEGQADFPVGGVSWYEAAAYAAFAGKSLPTVYHWYGAAALGRFADIVAASNFGGRGPAPVGSHQGLGPFGTYDMAGNVKEWCWNETDGQRFLLGGAWNEPRYMFADLDARGPFERAPGYGFRLVKYILPLPPAVAAPVLIGNLGDKIRKEKPVGDEIFAIYRRLYAYDRAPLDAVLESTEETDLWVKHTVMLETAYGGERMRVYLFLPKNGAPPYQTVAFFPGADAFLLRSSRDLSLAWGEPVIRSGRAFLYPVYKGTYERSTPSEDGPNAQRDLLIAWSRDLGRAIDYLETRPDIDRARIAFYAVSAGADAGVVLTAIEPRLKTGVLQSAAIGPSVPPEIDPVNYLPRIHIPMLVLNGRYDFSAPLETQQRPLFDLLGSPPAHKRHAVLEFGHALPIGDVALEMLPWLDRYLGPVR